MLYCSACLLFCAVLLCLPACCSVLDCCLVQDQVMMDTSTMSDIIAPAAKMAAQNKGQVRGGGAACQGTAGMDVARGG